MLQLQSSFAKIVLSSLCLGLVAPHAFAQDQSKNKQYNWAIDASYVQSTSGSAERDIDIASVGIRSWLVERPLLSIGVQAGLFESSGPANSDVRADAYGFYLGLPMRLTVNRGGQIRPFAELAISGIVTDRNWPDRPDMYDPVLEKARFHARFDAAIGAEFDVSSNTAIGLGLEMTHISNGRGFGADNLNFDGVGAIVSVTKRY